MLSRIANNLYWAGRYIERMEHIARCVPVLYFSALDGPEEIDLAYALKGINHLAGTIEGSKVEDENSVLLSVAFDKANPSSIISCASMARENCRGSRDLLSTELWECVNTLYHFVKEYDQEFYATSGMQQFMLNLQGKIAVCKARIETTLIRNQVWSILKIGLLVERSNQILRIVDSKLNFIDEIKQVDANMAIETYEIGNLTKCLESYDMNRKFYRKPVDRKNALEFLLFNSKFPRSLLYCLDKICEHLHLLGIDRKGKSASVILLAQKFCNELTYISIDDVLLEHQTFLDEYHNTVAELNGALVSKYFTQ